MELPLFRCSAFFGLIKEKKFFLIGQRDSELRNTLLGHAVDYSENSDSVTAELVTSSSELQKK